MPKYKCSECDFTSTIKCNVEKHLKFKKCKDKNPIMQILKNDLIFECPLCIKQYITKPGLTKHLIKCEIITKQKNYVNPVKKHNDEQLIELIKKETSRILQEKNEELKELREEFNEFKKTQQQTDEKVERVIKYLSDWHSPYIFEDIYTRFIFSLEKGRNNMMLTFTAFVSEVFDYKENKTVCHKNVKTKLITCHENSRWSIIDSNSVYPTINNNLYNVYMAFLKSTPLYESKTIQKIKNIQMEYENENRNNIQLSRLRIKLIEGHFKSINKQCDINEVGKDIKNALIAQNISYVFDTNSSTFEGAFVKTRERLFNVDNEESMSKYQEESQLNLEEFMDFRDDEHSDDEEYEHESDKFDNYYIENGNFNGTEIEGIEFLKMRRKIINSRRANKNWKTELEVSLGINSI